MKIPSRNERVRTGQFPLSSILIDEIWWRVERIALCARWFTRYVSQLDQETKTRMIDYGHGQASLMD